MNEQEAKSIALFFLLAFLDEKLALEATRRTLKKARGRQKSNLSYAFDIYLEYCGNSKHTLTATGIIQESSLVLPKVSISCWRQYVKDSRPEHIFPMIWTQILRETEKNVADAMGITVGTIRTRLSEDHRKLGANVIAEASHART